MVTTATVLSLLSICFYLVHFFYENDGHKVTAIEHAVIN